MSLFPNGNMTIGGILIQGSSRTLKKDIEPVDPAQVLAAVTQLPINSWSYKTEEARHIGPMAEDFFQVFGLGNDEMRIASLDTSGVALAAIQGLHRSFQQVVEDKDAEIADLTSRLEALERLVAELSNP